MTTRTHRFVRKIAPLLNKVEPYAIFFVYISAGIMAFFAWVFPPKVTVTMDGNSLIIQAVLLSIGAVLGLWGHTAKQELVEFWGLCAVSGGVFVLLCNVIAVMIYDEQYNYGQFAGMILLSLGFMISHGFKLYHDITESWINLPPAVIHKIYSD